VTSPIEALILDLVEWVSKEPRPYEEVIDAWRTSCPRLTVWEDASERGYIVSQLDEDRRLVVVATREGRQALAASRTQQV